MVGKVSLCGVDSNLKVIGCDAGHLTSYPEYHWLSITGLPSCSIFALYKVPNKTYYSHRALTSSLMT